MGVFEYGETCTLEAIPNEDYVFVEWTKDGFTVSSMPLFSFTVTGIAHYVAVFQSTVGTGENDVMTAIMFPNPAKDKLTIEATEPINRLEIYTINGTLVYSQKDCIEKIEVHVNDFAFGTYIVRVTTTSGVGISRFVKD